ncbi:hypothetical protein ABPG77_002399 [Micractinium sp. CCAP 211/92]
MSTKEAGDKEVGLAATPSKRGPSSAHEDPSEGPETADHTPKKPRTEGGKEGPGSGPAEAGGDEGHTGAAATGEAAEGTKKEGSHIIEQGTIQFFYRPKVGKEEVDSLDDVQRFFMLLRPDAAGVKSRMCVLGKKRLPSARRHERFFCFVEATAEDPAELLEGLGPKSYETRTRGTRHLEAARAVGEGTYALVEHPDRVNLVYKLEVPTTPGEAQLEFTIGEAGSFICQVKNPAGRGRDDPGLDQKAEYPLEKQEEFQHYSWIPPRDPQLFEYEHCEFLLIGARQDEELIGRLGQEGAQAAQQGGLASLTESERGAVSDEEGMLERLREEVQADKVGIFTEPAETGELL